MVMHEGKIELFFDAPSATEFASFCDDAEEKYSLHVCSLQEFSAFMEKTYCTSFQAPHHGEEC